MIAKIDGPAVIADYRAAYLRANGRELESSIRYELGWFIFSRFGRTQYRHRAAQMQAMTERLNARWPSHISEQIAAQEQT